MKERPEDALPDEQEVSLQQTGLEEDDREEDDREEDDREENDREEDDREEDDREEDFQEDDDPEDDPEDGEFEDELRGPPDLEEPPDLDSRILCSDGACIGIIGANGRCRECGKAMDPADEHLLQSTTQAPMEPAQQKAEDGSGHDPVEEDEEDGLDAPTPTSDSLDLDNRVLCPDGACIGVIGPDGRCKECGKPAE